MNPMTVEQLYDKLCSKSFQDTENGDLFYNFYLYLYPCDKEYRKREQIAAIKESINTVRQSAEEKEGLEIHLSTANDDEHRPDVIDIFDAITDGLAPRGIEFTYDFNANHDRFIHLDNGWKIILGRGLDIFDKVERFSIDRISQEERRCKACSISFVREEDQQ